MLLFCYHGGTIFFKLSIIKYLRLCCSWAIETDRCDEIKGRQQINTCACADRENTGFFSEKRDWTQSFYFWISNLSYLSTLCPPNMGVPDVTASWYPSHNQATVQWVVVFWISYASHLSIFSLLFIGSKLKCLQTKVTGSFGITWLPSHSLIEKKEQNTHHVFNPYYVPDMCNALWNCCLPWLLHCSPGHQVLCPLL